MPCTSLLPALGEEAYSKVTFGWTYLSDVLSASVSRMLEVRATWIGLGALIVLWLLSQTFVFGRQLDFWGFVLLFLRNVSVADYRFSGSI